MLAAGVIDEAMLDRAHDGREELPGLPRTRGPAATGSKLAELGLLRGAPGNRALLLGVVGIDRLERLFSKLFDEDEFLSPHGLRAMSAYHREHPYVLEVEGIRAAIDYEPAESTTAMFGGNSNWRGPIWFPLNYLVISALERYDRFFGDDFTVEYPTGSGRQLPLERDRRRPARAARVDLPGRPRRPTSVLRRRRAAAARPGLEGQPDVQRVLPRRQRRPGSAPSHQTGWTGLVADLIRRRHGAVPSIGDVLRGRPADRGCER